MQEQELERLRQSADALQSHNDGLKHQVEVSNKQLEVLRNLQEKHKYLVGEVNRIGELLHKSENEIDQHRSRGNENTELNKR